MTLRAADPPPHAHTPLEDAQAYVLGAAMCALGVTLLQSAGLVTGQTAGLAVLLAYLTPAGFPVWFFVVNLPFYVFGWFRLGPGFVLRTAIAVSLLSGFSALLSRTMTVEIASPWLASFLAGSAIGLGLLAVFRHRASLGGIGILAVWVQERLGVQAGYVQIGFDLVLFGAAATVLDPWLVLASVLGAMVINLIVAVNHRRDLYVGR
jgi:uncharacterized membrane-anchored protein YitT (DUF2179 family)